MPGICSSLDCHSKKAKMKNIQRKDTQIIKAIFSAYAPVKTVTKKPVFPYSGFVKSFFTSRKQA
jgi:hypothetical protein